MDKTLEEFFEDEGWKKWESIHCGRVYFVWRKHGFEIDEDDIVDNWGKRRVTSQSD